MQVNYFISVIVSFIILNKFGLLRNVALKLGMFGDGTDAQFQICLFNWPIDITNILFHFGTFLLERKIFP